MHERNICQYLCTVVYELVSVVSIEEKLKPTKQQTSIELIGAR